MAVVFLFAAAVLILCLLFLASLLARSVDVVLELDADLPLGGLVSDEGELEQLLRRRAAQVRLDETRVNEVDELLRPFLGLEPGWRIAGDEEEGSHGVHVTQSL